MASLREVCRTCTRFLVVIKLAQGLKCDHQIFPSEKQQKVVAHACNFSSQEEEAGGSQFPSQPELCSLNKTKHLQRLRVLGFDSG